MNLRRLSSTRHPARGRTVLIACALLAQAAAAWAQNICPQPITTDDFNKTVRNVSGHPVWDSKPGDIIEYRIKFCNVTAQPCSTRMVDFWDNILGQARIDPAHLDQTPVPGTSGCPTDGGTICQKGPRSGPTTTMNMQVCGVDCASVPPGPNDLYFTPIAGDPSSILQPNECYWWTIRAVIGGPIEYSECLCNAAIAQTGPVPPPPPWPGNYFPSHDPNYRSWGEGKGCADDAFCNASPPSPPCQTCVKIDIPPADISSSQKCIDGYPPPCNEDARKAQGQAITYNFVLANTGGNPAIGVNIEDYLNFTSSLGTPCLDWATMSDPGATVTCSWITPCPPDVIVYRNSFILYASAPRIPAGSSVRFSISGQVAANANGVCTNTWRLNHTVDNQGVDVPTNSPRFTVSAPIPDIIVTKDLAPGQDPTPRPGDPVNFVITVRNVGTGPANGLTIDDILASCFSSLGQAGRQCTGNVTCQGTPCPPARNCTYTASGFQFTGFNLAAGDGQPGGPDEVTITVNTTAGTTTGPCSNQAQTTDPGSGLPEQGEASVTIVSGNPDLTIDKRLAPGQPADVYPGNPVRFTIGIENIGGSALTNGTLDDTLDTCFEPLGTAGMPCDPMVVSCAGSGCASATCTYTANGFRYTGFDLAASDANPGGGQDYIEFYVSAQAGTRTGACNNTAVTSDPDSPSLSSRASVNILPAPALLVTKTPTPPSVGVNGDAQFTVVIDNSQGTVALTACSFTDNVVANGCIQLKSCDSTTPNIPVTCNVPTDLRSSSPFDVPAGQRQTIVFTVTAGATQNPSCKNTVQVTCHGTSGEATGTIAITPCPLMTNNPAITFPPVTPAKTANGGRWVYTSACDGLTQVQDANPATGNDIGAAAGTAGNLALYQMDCACSARVRLTKDAAYQRIVLDLN